MKKLGLGNGDGFLLFVLWFACDVHFQNVKLLDLQIEKLKPYCWFSRTCKGKQQQWCCNLNFEFMTKVGAW
jgi:hypothetical protein